MGVMQDAFQGSLGKSGPPGNWRNDIRLFNPDADIQGCINISPAWFQQGRHVSVAYEFIRPPEAHILTRVPITYRKYRRY